MARVLWCSIVSCGDCMYDLFETREAGRKDRHQNVGQVIRETCFADVQSLD
jgi:hypothetical protein